MIDYEISYEVDEDGYYGGLRWWVNAHVKRLRTHLKEDQ